MFCEEDSDNKARQIPASRMCEWMKGDVGGQYIKEGILRRNWRRGIKMTIQWGEQMKGS